MKIIDNFLNNITMYRLVLYYLALLVVIAAILSAFGILAFNLFAIIGSTIFLIAVCWITNTIFAKTYKAHTNVDSVYITALILALIITPIRTPSDIIFFVWVGIWAMASKYIVALNKKHLFNPAAFAVLLTAITLNNSASWWVGTSYMMPFVLLGGLLIVRKLGRFDMVFSFLVASLITIVGFSLVKGTPIITILQKTFIDSPLLFFAFIMLTEPLTTPPSKKLRIIYGSIVGVLFSPQLQIGGLFTTPESALILGNVFSYIVSPKQKLLLELKEKVKVAEDVYDFVFHTNKKVAFTPGQYMEWTLGHKNPDSRGSRRYLTIASSPTEDNFRIGVKFHQQPSTFKKSMLTLPAGSNLMAGQLSGDFILPEDPMQKCVFIAGGIGITPFRSMIKYLIDIGQKRDIVLFYANKTVQDIVYKNIFDEAAYKLGIRIIYTLTDQNQIPANWPGYVGYITQEMITQEVPDYKERIFYLSGPRSMVENFEDTLNKMAIPKTQIKIDYFPGFA